MFFGGLFFVVFLLIVVVLESLPDKFCFGGVDDFVDGSWFGQVEAFG